MSGEESRSLLQRLQGIIERTYDLETGIRDVSPFIIGDEGFARLYDGRSVWRSVGSGRREGGVAPGLPGGDLENRIGRVDPHRERVIAGAGSVAEGADPVSARTLLRQEGGGLRVCLYYPDRLIENLERNDPGRTLSDGNVDDFATLIEELDHLLTIADRHRAGAEVSLLELELHANVTKELVLRLFVARMRGRDQILDDEGSWIRHHLFDKVEYREEDPAVQARYRDAASLAVRYLDALRSLPADDRPRELRRFHRRSHHEKLAHLSRL